MSDKRNVRPGIVSTSANTICRSRLCHLIVLSLITLILAIAATNYVDLGLPMIFIGIFTTLFAIYYRRELIFEALLVDNMVQSTFGLFQWYSTVDENLYLGAIPLQPDIERLIRRQGITALLSIVDDYEIQCVTAVGRPVTAAEWKYAGLDFHLVIPSPDFLPPSFAALDAGAAFINHHLSEGRRVYCHCKSGRGRSASIILAYFVKYKREDLHTAHSKLKLRRPLVFNRNSAQMRNMEKYIEYITSPISGDTKSDT